MDLKEVKLKMSEEIKLSEESLRRIASQKVTFRYSIKLHSTIYILGNILLFTINAIFSPFLWWAIYPLFGWLIGLVIHGLAYMLYAKGTSYGVRGVLFHCAAYVFGMLLLVVINYMTTGILSWVLYPAIFWTIGFLMHTITYVVFFRGKSDRSERKPSKKERAIEKEMQKMRERLKEQEGAM